MHSNNACNRLNISYLFIHPFIHSFIFHSCKDFLHTCFVTMHSIINPSTRHALIHPFTKSIPMSSISTHSGILERMKWGMHRIIESMHVSRQSSIRVMQVLERCRRATTGIHQDSGSFGVIEKGVIKNCLIIPKMSLTDVNLLPAIRSQWRSAMMDGLLEERNF